MEIGAICDTDPAKAAVVEPSYPGVPFFTDYIALLDSGDVDAVVTCVPHYLHPEMGINALQRGIHALVEKPAGVYTQQVKELNAYAATKPELTFGIMFNQRNNPLYQQDQGDRRHRRDRQDPPDELDHHHLVAAAGLLRPERLARHLGRRGRRRPGQPGTAPARPVAVDLRHPASRCTPRSRTASAGTSPSRTRSPRVVDYGDGATGTFVTATHDLVGTDRFEILGDQGKIVVEGSKTATVTRLRKPERELSDGMDMDDVMQAVHRAARHRRASTPRRSSSSTPPGARSTPACCRTSPRTSWTAPRCSRPGSDGINGVRLANAIHLSSWTGTGGPAGLRRGRVPDRAEQAHPRGRHLPGTLSAPGAHRQRTNPPREKRK